MIKIAVGTSESEIRAPAEEAGSTHYNGEETLLKFRVDRIKLSFVVGF